LASKKVPTTGFFQEPFVGRAMDESINPLRILFCFFHLYFTRALSLTDSLKMKKAPFAMQKILSSECPRLDSNQHTTEGTSPSSWHVYQFHHVGF
jgi:hypothetical protein